MSEERRFGRCAPAALSHEIIAADTRDLPLQDIDRQVLFTVLCLANLDNGICCGPLRFKPASAAVIPAFSRLDSTAQPASARAGFVLIYQLANGYYRLEHSSHGRDLSTRIARGLGFAVELLHRIPSNDHQQAHALLTSRYAHCRRLQRWYRFAPPRIA